MIGVRLGSAPTSSGGSTTFPSRLSYDFVRCSKSSARPQLPRPRLMSPTVYKLWKKAAMALEAKQGQPCWRPSVEL